MRGFGMQVLTSCNAKITSTRTAAGQFKVVQWNVTHGFDSQEISPTATTHIQQRSAFQWGDG